MRSIRLAAALGAVGVPALLGVLALTVGLDAYGWLGGTVAGGVATALLIVGRLRSGDLAILPPDWTTLARALLAAGGAGIVASNLTGSVAATLARPGVLVPLLVLSSVALALDAVDGPIARRTGTATPFGARFDGEVDAVLILVLSVAVSRNYGGWVLIIGAARYAFLVAGWVLPWLAAPLPFRYWRKVVTAVQGVALVVAASGLLPRTVGMIVVGGALLLLAESFGRDVIWLYRAGMARPDAPGEPVSLPHRVFG